MYCKMNDLEVFYEIHGEGKPIIMIHGFGPDHRTMTGCMETIFEKRSGWKRIYFDLPGMGKTKAVDWVKNSDDMVKVVLEFIAKVIPNESFLIVGESYGGYLARAIIRERAKDIDGMFLICPLAIARDSERDVPERSIMKKDDSVLKGLNQEERDLFDACCVVQTEETWNRFKEEMFSGFEIGDEEFKGIIREADAYEFSSGVDKLAAPFEKPSLIVTGRQDSLVGYKDTWNFLDNYPRCTFAVLDMAGHALQIEQEELFSALVNEWLDRVMDFKQLG